jgi:hypothetical protein
VFLSHFFRNWTSPGSHLPHRLWFKKAYRFTDLRVRPLWVCADGNKGFAGLIVRQSALALPFTLSADWSLIPLVGRLAACTVSEGMFPRFGVFL